MESNGASASSFGEALQHALGQRGLPLARVQAHLATMGHSIALSTISQWAHGRRLPRSPKSMEVVEALERILRVTPGTLVALVPESTARELTPLSRESIPHVTPLGSLMDRLGVPFGKLTPISNFDRIAVDARGSQVRRRATCTVVARTPTERHVISHRVDEGHDPEAVTFTARSGCRLGRVLRDAESGVAAAELHFDRVLAPGEYAVYAVQIDDLNGARTTDFQRASATEVPLVMTEIYFSRKFLPTMVTAFHAPKVGAPDLTCHELVLERNDRVHLIRQPAEPGVHGIRWTWPE